ncbi:MAG: glutamyl-tRNA reductase, partial [Chloroflexota bacterium]
MTVFVIGLSHHTAPVELRECLHFSPERRMLTMEKLSREGGLDECVVLSTCNRFEVYGVATDSEDASERIAQMVQRDNDLPVGELSS